MNEFFVCSCKLQYILQMTCTQETPGSLLSTFTYRGCRSRGGHAPLHPILADPLSLFQQLELQIFTILLLAPSDFKTFLRSCLLKWDQTVSWKKKKTLLKWMNHIVRIRDFSRMMFKYVCKYVLQFHEFDQWVIPAFIFVFFNSASKNLQYICSLLSVDILHFCSVELCQNRGGKVALFCCVVEITYLNLSWTLEYYGCY